MCQNLLFGTYLLLYKNMIFDQIHIGIFYHFGFKRLFDYSELKRYVDLPKQTKAILDPDHFG